MSKILVIEDDQELNQQLAQTLRNKGYQVDQCYDGEDGLSQAARQVHQLVLLDVMLPGRDGFSVLKLLRKTCQTPVMMLTAKGAEQERILGFTAGADEYMTKPFNVTELLLRIEALLRRCSPSVKQEQALQKIDGLVLDRIAQQVSIEGGEQLEMTPTQFKLLWILVQQRGEVLSKVYLYQVVLNRTFSNYDRSLDMHLSRVRRKLVAAGWQGERLQTVHGKGYLFA